VFSRTANCFQDVPSSIQTQDVPSSIQTQDVPSSIQPQDVLEEKKAFQSPDKLQLSYLLYVILPTVGVRPLINFF
jgi:hypothetical protein